MWRVNAFDYYLPKNLIAQFPASPRDHAKLLVLDRETGKIKHQFFYQILESLTSQDVVVLNQTKVFPARLIGQKETGGKVEILLLKKINSNTWEAISRPGLKNGQIVKWLNGLQGQVIKPSNNFGKIEIRFNLSGKKLFKEINKIGLTPIPPYINSTYPEAVIKKITKLFLLKSLVR